MLKRLVCGHAKGPNFVHQVLSICSLGTVGPEIQAAGVPVHALGLRSAVQLPLVFLKLVRFIRAERPDVVHTWMYHSDLLGGLAAYLAGCGRVLWGVRVADIAPEFGVSRSTGWIRRVCGHLSNYLPSRIIYVAESARRRHEAFGYSAEKSIVIPNGYAIPKLSKEKAKARFRAELGLDSGALLVGAAARYNIQKNQLGFVRACAQVAAHVPTARFVLCGRGVTHENRELMQTIQMTGCPDRYFVLGERHDLLYCLAAMDVFCMNSLVEGFPNVVAEAMSVSVPCIVTDVGDAAHLVGNTGQILPPNNDQALIEAIVKMLRMVPTARLRLGQLARARIKSKFSLEAIIKRYECVYEEVGARRPPVDDRPSTLRYEESPPILHKQANC